MRFIKTIFRDIKSGLHSGVAGKILTVTILPSQLVYLEHGQKTVLNLFTRVYWEHCRMVGSYLRHHPSIHLEKMMGLLVLNTSGS